MNISIEELERLIEEYLLTLPNDDEDEFYLSSRVFAERELDGFLTWLKGRPTSETEI